MINSHSIKLFQGITHISDDIIREAETVRLHRKSSAAKYLAAAAAVCLIAAGVHTFLSHEKGPVILHWTDRFSAEDYFRYGLDGISESKVSDSIAPYAETRFFSDRRSQMEAEGMIPILDSHPLFDCCAHYNADGSLYSLEFSWHRRGDTEDYSDLKITAGHQEVPQINDCIFIEIDENGNILEPGITVTERDGINITATGRPNRDKTLTFQNASGWYQISGSWNDDCDSVAALLDWLWEHPVDFGFFSLADP